MLESTKVPALTRAIEILNLIGRIGPCSAATIGTGVSVTTSNTDRPGRFIGGLRHPPDRAVETIVRRHRWENLTGAALDCLAR